MRVEEMSTVARELKESTQGMQIEREEENFGLKRSTYSVIPDCFVGLESCSWRAERSTVASSDLSDLMFARTRIVFSSTFARDRLPSRLQTPTDYRHN